MWKGRVLIMGNWTNKPVALEPIKFDGDSVVFTASRLLVEDMMVLSKHFDQAKGVMRFNSPLEVCAMAGDILPKYIKSISGYTIDGQPMTLDEFFMAVREFYFVPLVGELFGKLVLISSVGVQEKNSAAPSPESSEV